MTVIMARKNTDEYANSQWDGWDVALERFSQSRLGVYDLIDAERDKQDAKWGPQNHSTVEWSTILGEEFGEACQQALRHHFSSFSSDDHVDSYGKLRGELVQVAAVATAWLEVL